MRTIKAKIIAKKIVTYFFALVGYVFFCKVVTIISGMNPQRQFLLWRWSPVSHIPGLCDVSRYYHDIIDRFEKIKYVQIRFFRWNSWFDLKLVQISRHKSPILDACVRLSYNTFKKGAGVRWTYVWHEAGDLVCSQLLMIYFTYISIVSVGFWIWKYCFVLLINFCFWLSFICVSHLYFETDKTS